MATRSDDRDLNPPDPSERQRYMMVDITIVVTTEILTCERSAEDDAMAEGARIESMIKAAGFEAEFTEHNFQ